MRFRSRMSEIDLAIIAESARWGHGRTRDADWLTACNGVLDTYLTLRRDILVSLFRNRGWFPRLDVPRFSTNNAVVPYGHLLRVSATNTFYYTTDGSDPRLPGGWLNPSAAVVTQTVSQIAPQTLIPLGAVWRYFDSGIEPTATNGLTWRDKAYPDSAWQQGPATLGFAGSATANAVAATTRRYVNGVSGTQVTTAYFRRAFTVGSTNGISGLSISILRDDGAVIYLNGTEILRENMPTGVPTYATWSSDVVGSPDQNTTFTRSVSAANLLRTGTNVVSVELHQCNATSSDMYFNLALTTAVSPEQTATCFSDIPVTRAVMVKARTYNGTEWSALSEVALTVYTPPADYSPLRVSELMYAPPSPAAGSPYVNDDFAWIELRNTGAASLNLEGVRFASGIAHTFAPFTLPAGARLVLAKNLAAFSTLYATNGLSLMAWTSGNLARKGETLSLVNPGGSNILTFTYSNAWYPSTYNAALSLVAVNLAASEPVWSTAANWRPSHTAHGSPGQPDAPLLTTLALAGSATLSLSTEGLDGVVEVWCSTNLTAWTLCPQSTWAREGDSLTVNLLAPALPPSPKRFFQLRLRD